MSTKQITRSPQKKATRSRLGCKVGRRYWATDEVSIQNPVTHPRDGPGFKER